MMHNDRCESQKRLANIDDICYSIQRKVKPTKRLEATSKEIKVTARSRSGGRAVFASTPTNLSASKLEADQNCASARLLGGDRENAEVDFCWTLQLIYKETKAYLESLGRAASEGRAIDEANNFLRWLQFSSILRLLEKNPSVNPNFVTLRNQCNDLQAICRPHLQGRRMVASPSQARIDEVNAKVDIILAAIAKPVSPSQKHTLDAGQPALSVIAGEGASSRQTAALPCVGQAAG
jgi:hypothetical protein